ncbi:39S ribosomal protein S18a, mitochondrial [Contarinia nasturtii]|uniref:39S ribosomal protein S18a, mitochondrial n=1 Tax=Contarinia nasturtii TaxID=265458 RepID=UPI0012D47D64|nr:39S ribosomal protein S18a, mitochondrial [Contarinia nasturtii]
MMTLNKVFRLNNRIPLISQRIQSISTTSALGVKEIKVEQKSKVLEISADLKPSPREATLLKEVHSTDKKFCPKCTLGLDIKHTDVLILKQYLREDGTMMPRRITRLCAIQQKNIGTMVLMARRAGLLPLPAQLASKKPNKCYGYKGLNHYYDEQTIKYAKLYVNTDENKKVGPKRKVDFNFDRI